MALFGQKIRAFEQTMDDEVSMEILSRVSILEIEATSAPHLVVAPKLPYVSEEDEAEDAKYSLMSCSPDTGNGEEDGEEEKSEGDTAVFLDGHVEKQGRRRTDEYEYEYEYEYLNGNKIDRGNLQKKHIINNNNHRRNKNKNKSRYNSHKEQNATTKRQRHGSISRLENEYNTTTTIATNVQSVTVSANTIYYTISGYVFKTPIYSHNITQQAIRPFSDRTVHLICTNNRTTTLVAGSKDGYLKTENCKEWKRAHSGKPSFLKVSNDGNRIISTCRNHLRIHDSNLEPVVYDNHWIQCKRNEITCIALGHGLITVGLINGSIVIFDFWNGTFDKLLKYVHTCPIISLIILPGSCVLSVGKDGSVLVHVIEQSKSVPVDGEVIKQEDQELEEGEKEVVVGVSENGRCMAFFDQDVNGILVIDINSRQVISNFDIGDSDVVQIESVSDNGCLVVWRDNQNTLKFFNSV